MAKGGQAWGQEPQWFRDEAKGFGFIRSPEVFALWQSDKRGKGSDVYTKMDQLEPFAIGDVVEFLIRQTPDGKPQ
eukprot:gene29069-42389_t